MEETREFTGKTVEEALECALSELNVSKDDIEYEVLLNILAEYPQ